MGDAIPPEVVEQLKRFNETLCALEDIFQSHFDVPYEEHKQRPPLDKARLDVMSVFAINSLYWILLCTHGRSPRQNELLQNEINRTKDYVERLRQVEDRGLAPRVNQAVARSIIRNALWEPGVQAAVSCCTEFVEEYTAEVENEDETGVTMETFGLQDPQSVVVNPVAQKRRSQYTSKVEDCTKPKKRRA